MQYAQAGHWRKRLYREELFCFGRPLYSILNFYSKIDEKDLESSDYHEISR
jgi:hypothetical protein